MFNGYKRIKIKTENPSNMRYKPFLFYLILFLKTYNVFTGVLTETITRDCNIYMEKTGLSAHLPILYQG